MIEFEAKLSEFGTVINRQIPKAVKKVSPLEVVEVAGDFNVYLVEKFEKREDMSVFQVIIVDENEDKNAYYGEYTIRPYFANKQIEHCKAQVIYWKKFWENYHKNELKSETARSWQSAD